MTTPVKSAPAVNGGPQTRTGAERQALSVNATNRIVKRTKTIVGLPARPQPSEIVRRWGLDRRDYWRGGGFRAECRLTLRESGNKIGSGPVSGSEKAGKKLSQGRDPEHPPTSLYVSQSNKVTATYLAARSALGEREKTPEIVVDPKPDPLYIQECHPKDRLHRAAARPSVKSRIELGLGAQYLMYSACVVSSR